GAEPYGGCILRHRPAALLLVMAGCAWASHLQPGNSLGPGGSARHCMPYTGYLTGEPYPALQDGSMANLPQLQQVGALDTDDTVWQFNVVPDAGPALATWTKASPQNPPTGGATWTSYALDELSGTLYVTTGNPAPDFVVDLRPGDNLYTTAVLGLDARTGKLQTYIQPIKHDFHDW